MEITTCDVGLASRGKGGLGYLKVLFAILDSTDLYEMKAAMVF